MAHCMFNRDRGSVKDGTLRNRCGRCVGQSAQREVPVSTAGDKLDTLSPQRILPSVAPDSLEQAPPKSDWQLVLCILFCPLRGPAEGWARLRASLTPTSHIAPASTAANSPSFFPTPPAQCSATARSCSQRPNKQCARPPKPLLRQPHILDLLPPPSLAQHTSLSIFEATL